MKSKSAITSNSSREILWSTQGTAILPAGSERSSLSSQDQGRKRTHRRRNVKCTTQILIFGSRCQIWTLAVITTHHALSETHPSMSSVVLQTQLENTSTPSSDTTNPIRISGLRLMSTTRCSQRGKDAVQFRKMDNTFWFSEAFQVSSSVTATISTAWATICPALQTLPMIYFCSKCRQFMTRTHLQYTPVTCRGIRFIGSITVTTGVSTKLCAHRSEHVLEQMTNLD